MWVWFQPLTIFHLSCHISETFAYSHICTRVIKRIRGSDGKLLHTKNRSNLSQQMSLRSGCNTCYWFFWSMYLPHLCISDSCPGHPCNVQRRRFTFFRVESVALLLVLSFSQRDLWFSRRGICRWLSMSCSAAKAGISPPTFQRSVLPPPSRRCVLRQYGPLKRR